MLRQSSLSEPHPSSKNVDFPYKSTNCAASVCSDRVIKHKEITKIQDNEKKMLTGKLVYVTLAWLLAHQ